MTTFAIHGHAIVSDDDRIAGPDGLTPAALRNDADWAYFQAALDAAAFTALGRKGHEANPNAKRRRRLVLTRSVDGLVERDGAWWWNPAGLAFDAAACALAPFGGIVSVPGGRDVFDFFLKRGFDEFHLARAEGVRVPGGRALFAACDAGRAAEDVLSAAGLRSGQRVWLDRDARVSLAVWRRA